MKTPLNYDDPANFDVDNRPSNRKLHSVVATHGILASLLGAFAVPTLYVCIVGTPISWVSGLFMLIGAVISPNGVLLIYRFHGKNKKAEFVTAGGNADEMTLPMLGAMGGKRLSDGRWEWFNEKSLSSQEIPVSFLLRMKQTVSGRFKRQNQEPNDKMPQGPIEEKQGIS